MVVPKKVPNSASMTFPFLLFFRLIKNSKCLLLLFEREPFTVYLSCFSIRNRIAMSMEMDGIRISSDILQTSSTNQLMSFGNTNLLFFEIRIKFLC